METTIILPTGGILYLSGSDGILIAFEAVKILNISLNLYKRAKSVKKTGKNEQKWVKCAEFDKNGG